MRAILDAIGGRGPGLVHPPWLLLAFALFGGVLTPGRLEAQQWTISGRVTDAGSGAPIAGASVELQDRRPVLTSGDGRFRIGNVASGRYSLVVRALGWNDVEPVLVVRGDTTLVVEMERAPVQLDTIAVESRRISIRGVVSDAATGLELIDVDVETPPDRTATTNVVGQFRFKDMPGNTPVSLYLQEMGYLPRTVEVTASEDTTVRIGLEIDPVAHRMMENAKARLAARAEERTWSVVPAVTRADLTRNVNRSVKDVLDEMLRIRSGSVACIVVDERASVVNDMLLETMLPDRVEHIEVLEFGFDRTSLMVRIYTREYFPAVMLPNAELLSRDALVKAARSGVCR